MIEYPINSNKTRYEKITKQTRKGPERSDHNNYKCHFNTVDLLLNDLRSCSRILLFLERRSFLRSLSVTDDSL